MGASQSTPLRKAIQTAAGGPENCAFPGDTFYALKSVKLYNLAISVKPAAIVYPKTALQVAAIVKCVADAGLKIQPRSGDRNYANYCMFSNTQFSVFKDL